MSVEHAPEVPTFGRLVGRVIVPAAPDHIQPGAGENPDGVSADTPPPPGFFAGCLSHLAAGVRFVRVRDDGVGGRPSAHARTSAHPKAGDRTDGELMTARTTAASTRDTARDRRSIS